MLAFYTPKIRFTREQLLDMLILQSKANDVMSDAWRLGCNCTHQYYRAAHMESSEAIDHIGWKWWKTTPCDMEQAKIELIDIKHFALGHTMREAYIATSVDGETFTDEAAEYAADHLLEMDMTVTIEPIGKYYSDDAYEKIQYLNNEVDIDKFPLVDLMELFNYNSLEQAEPNWPVLLAMFDAAGMTADEVYKIYVDKNLLNIFRTSNGQRTNDYYKLWDSVEDNVYVEKYREQKAIEGISYSVNDLLDYLQTTYSEFVAAGKIAKA